MMQRGVWLLISCCALVRCAAPLQAQTEGTCAFTVRTVRIGGEYDPRHILAIWVENASQQFVKTLKVQADDRIRHLYTWDAKSNRNDTDAVTGATLRSHTTHSVTWDGRDTTGAVVPDGTYRIRVEYTDEHRQGPLAAVNFTKGPEPDSATPSDTNTFKDMDLTYMPDIATHVLIPSGSDWRYSATGTDLHSSAWKDVTYDDDTWPEGPGKLGYSDSPDTPIDDSTKYPCYYFRHSFPMSFTPQAATLRVLRDDGVIVYLNGEEVVRSNMPSGAVGFSTFASSSVGGSEEDSFFQFIIDPSHFVLGMNVLAAEVHQRDLGSSDLGFDLELKTDPPPVVTTTFTRGDTNGSASVDVADAVFVLGHLFASGAAPSCMSSADINDDGRIDISDAVAILMHLFGSAGNLPEPFTTCGTDPTPDALTCDSFATCE